MRLQLNGAEVQAATGVQEKQKRLRAEDEARTAKNRNKRLKRKVGAAWAGSVT